MCSLACKKKTECYKINLLIFFEITAFASGAVAKIPI